MSGEYGDDRKQTGNRRTGRRLFSGTRVLSAGEYRALIGTYSDHIAMEESIREKFFDRIEETINRYGGSISLSDTIDLQLARKP